MVKGCYEDYPLWIVVLSNTVPLAIYAIGAFLIYQVGVIWMIAYLAYAFWLETRVMSKSCVNCYYYGKFCALGKGKLCALFFKKGSSVKFATAKISWRDIIPDFLVGIVPIVVGIGLLVATMNWLILAPVIALGLLVSLGNGIVRGSLACRYCKQRKIGCPAEKLFNRK